MSQFKSLLSATLPVVLVTMVSATSPVPMTQAPATDNTTAVSQLDKGATDPSAGLANKQDSEKPGKAKKDQGTSLSPAPSRVGEPSANGPAGSGPANQFPTSIPDSSSTTGGGASSTSSPSSSSGSFSPSSTR